MFELWINDKIDSFGKYSVSMVKLDDAGRIEKAFVLKLCSSKDEQSEYAEDFGAFMGYTPKERSLNNN